MEPDSEEARRSRRRKAKTREGSTVFKEREQEREKKNGLKTQAARW